MYRKPIVSKILKNLNLRGQPSKMVPTSYQSAPLAKDFNQNAFLKQGSIVDNAGRESFRVATRWTERESDDGLFVLTAVGRGHKDRGYERSSHVTDILDRSDVKTLDPDVTSYFTIPLGVIVRTGCIRMAIFRRARNEP
jgi:hypothetical protein